MRVKTRTGLETTCRVGGGTALKWVRFRETRKRSPVRTDGPRGGRLPRAGRGASRGQEHVPGLGAERAVPAAGASVSTCGGVCSSVEVSEQSDSACGPACRAANAGLPTRVPVSPLGLRSRAS